MTTLVLLANTTPWYTWVFSGLGIFVLSGVISIVAWMRRRHGGNNKNLCISTRCTKFIARDIHDSYDYVLAIYISNTGNDSISIQEALFRTRVPFLVVCRKKSLIPVYPKAFVHVEKRAYELKFGKQWNEHHIVIPPGDKVMTYLPLQHPVPDEETNRGRLGEVLLHWKIEGACGTHSVFV